MKSNSTDTPTTTTSKTDGTFLVRAIEDLVARGFDVHVVAGKHGWHLSLIRNLKNLALDVERAAIENAHNPDPLIGQSLYYLGKQMDELPDGKDWDWDFGP